MWKYIISFSLIATLTSGCDTLSFLAQVERKTSVVTKTDVVYPFLPDIEKPIPPVLKQVVVDYPRDLTKGQQLKTTPDCLQTATERCLEYPLANNSNLFIGMTLENFKNYVSNNEQINGYIKGLLLRIDEINVERARWRDSNLIKKDK